MQPSESATVAQETGAVPSRPSTPRRIIQTGPREIPLLLRSAIVNTKLLHPDFDYMFFDDVEAERFVREQFPEHLNVFHSFRFPIQKYDFFRYLAVYRYGGFYLDLDVFLVRDLSPLLSSECVFPFEELTAVKYLQRKFEIDWQIGNYAFGAPPGHPFLSAIIANCVRAQRDPGWVEPMLKSIPRLFRDQFFILNTTGPGLVTRTLGENPHLAGSVNVLFPDDVRDPRYWHHFGAYGVHCQTGSWRGRPSFSFALMTRLWDAWTLRRIAAESRKSGPTRCVPVASAAP